MILKLFLFWRISLLFLTYLGSLIFLKMPNGGIGAIGPGKPFDYWASWAQWDGGHYIFIAQNGYIQSNSYAFFPLYPILIKILSFFFFGNEILAGLVISNICFLTFLYVFYKLAEMKTDKNKALIATFTLLVFPTTYFLGAVYTESLFLLLTALTFLLLEKKKLLVAAIIAGAATLTRFVGVFLIIPVVYYYIKSINFSFKKVSLKAFVIPLTLTPFIIYCTYLYIKFNDPFYFSTVQSIWHRSATSPATTIYSYLTTNLPGKAFNDHLDIIATILFIVILIIGRKKLPLSWILYSLIVILIPVSSGTLTSMPRYVLSAFPVFILASYFLEKHTVVRYVAWISFLILQVALTIMFINGHWTA